ncbi:hypothetical protein CRM22_002427 [Opisthorchis felineus]|uniref:Uncharacterized protein n=1 Tax=Opisthorchis felineus TaxID=147828 RepID=A0A4S2M607_OPIFE|nr:hypothetical protein CRM22_002427 [Opisthorchis felineus]
MQCNPHYATQLPILASQLQVVLDGFHCQFFGANLLCESVGASDAVELFNNAGVKFCDVLLSFVILQRFLRHSDSTFLKESLVLFDGSDLLNRSLRLLSAAYPNHDMFPFLMNSAQLFDRASLALVAEVLDKLQEDSHFRSSLENMHLTLLHFANTPDLNLSDSERIRLIDMICAGLVHVYAYNGGLQRDEAALLVELIQRISRRTDQRLDKADQCILGWLSQRLTNAWLDSSNFTKDELQIPEIMHQLQATLDQAIPNNHWVVVDPYLFATLLTSGENTDNLDVLKANLLFAMNEMYLFSDVKINQVQIKFWLQRLTSMNEGIGGRALINSASTRSAQEESHSVVQLSQISRSFSTNQASSMPIECTPLKGTLESALEENDCQEAKLFVSDTTSNMSRVDRLGSFSATTVYEYALRIRKFLSTIDTSDESQGLVVLTRNECAMLASGLQCCLEIAEIHKIDDCPLIQSVVRQLHLGRRQSDGWVLTTEVLEDIKRFSDQCTIAHLKQAGEQVLQLDSESMSMGVENSHIPNNIRAELFRDTHDNLEEPLSLRQIRKLAKVFNETDDATVRKSLADQLSNTWERLSNTERKHSLLEYTACLAHLVAIKNSLSGGNGNALESGDRYSLAYILRLCKAIPEISMDKTQAKSIEETVSGLIQGANAPDHTSSTGLDRLANQINFAITNIAKLLQINLESADANSVARVETDSSRIPLFSTLLWTAITHKPSTLASTLCNSPLMSPIIKTEPNLKETVEFSLQPLENESRPNLCSLLLEAVKEAECFTAKCQCSQPEDLAALVVHLAHVRELARCLGISTTPTITAVVDGLLDQLVNDEHVPAVTLEMVKEELAKTASLSRDLVEDSLNGALLEVNSGKLSESDHLADGGNTNSEDGVRLKAVGNEKVIDALGMAIMCKKAKIPVKLRFLIGIMEKLRNSSANALTRDELSIVNQILSSASDSVKSEEFETTLDKPGTSYLIECPELAGLAEGKVLNPVEAAQLFDDITEILNSPSATGSFSEELCNSLHSVKTQLLRASVSGQSVNVGGVVSSPDALRNILVNELKKIEEKESSQIRQDLVERLQLFRMYAFDDPTRVNRTGDNRLSVLKYCGSFDTAEATQRLDPKTTALLHRCVLEQMRRYPPLMSTMLPLLGILVELEESKDITVSTEKLDEKTQEQLYVPMEISAADLDIVTTFLSTPKGSPPNLGEQLTALFFVQRTMDGEALWPAEASLLLAGLETLASSSDMARKRIINELEGMKSQLLKHSFMQESVEDICDAAGFEISDADCKKLRSLHRVCEIPITRNARQFVERILRNMHETYTQRNDISSDQLLMLHIFVLYLARQTALTPRELAILNRLMVAISTASIDDETLCMLSSLYEEGRVFMLHETHTLEIDSTVINELVEPTPQNLCGFIPDMLEELLGASDVEKPLPYGCTLLLTGMLHTLTLMHSQLGWEKLAPKWIIHLKRLVWRLLGTALLRQPVKLDVRSRALISIACNNYRDILKQVFLAQTEDSLHRLEAVETTGYLSATDKKQLADTIGLVLTSPLSYHLTPNVCGMLAQAKESLSRCTDQSRLSDYELQFLSRSLQRIRENIENRDLDVVTTTDLIVSLQTAEQILDRVTSSESNDEIRLPQKDAAILNLALEVLNNRSHQQGSLQSWDSDDYSAISNDCRAVLGLTQSFLSSVLNTTEGTNFSGDHCDSIRLSDNEIDKLKELINFWKPRLALEAQHQRTATIRKLAVSNECDLTADMTNSELCNAIQLTIANGHFMQAHDAWISVRALEELQADPEMDYVNISNPLRDALRLAMCPMRDNTSTSLVDANVISCLTYLLSLLPSLFAQYSSGSLFGMTICPSDAAAFGTCLMTVLQYMSTGCLSPIPHRAMLQQHEQRSLCAAANLENYELNLSEATEVSELLQEVKTQLGRLVHRELIDLVASLTTLEEDTDPDLVVRTLEPGEKELLIQILRIFMLLGTPEAGPQYLRRNLHGLLDYLIYARPTCITVSQRCELRQLCDSFEAALSHPDLPVPVRVGRIRSTLQSLTSNESIRFSLLSRPVRVHPREAMLLLDLLRQMISATGIPSSETALLQAALGHAVASGQTWCQWDAIPRETKSRILAHICTMIESLIDMMKDNEQLTDQEASNLELVAICLNRLLQSIEEERSATTVLSLLQVIGHLLPKEPTISEKHRLQRSTRVEEDSSELYACEDSLMRRMEQVERDLDSSEYLFNSEVVASMLEKTHYVKQALENSKIDEEDQRTVQELEDGIFKIIIECPENGETKTVQTQSCSLSRLRPLLTQVRQICREAENVLPANSTDKLHNPPESASEPENFSPSVLVQFSPTVEQAYAAFGRLVTPCTPRVMEPGEIAELTASVDIIHRATHQVTPLYKDQIQMSPTEKQLLQDLQRVADKGETYFMDDSSIEKLQSLGQRLMTPILQVNRDLLKKGLALWLSASINGRFVFSSTETSQLHSALCLARNTITREKPGGSVDESLRMIDRVIEQFSTTVDSGIGTELTGPHSMGPVVTGILEDAQRAHESVNLSVSVFSTPPSSISEWCSNYRVGADDRQFFASSSVFPSNLTDEYASQNLQPENQPSASVWRNELPEPLLAASKDSSNPPLLHQMRSPSLQNPDLDREPKGHKSRRSISGGPTRDLASPLRSKTLAEAVGEEQKRLKTWEKLVEARLNQACTRVEDLLAMFPTSNSDETVSEDTSRKERFDELQRLREEVLYLKQQLRRVVLQLEEAERKQQRQTLYVSSLRELIGRQNRSTSQSTSTQTTIPISTADSKTDQCCTFPLKSTDSHKFRLYRSTDCLQHPSSQPAQPNRSNEFSRIPLDTETFDFLIGPPRPHRLSSLDRLHELIEIRRAVVAGSREELCRLGAYSSLPPLKSPHLLPHQRTSQTSREYTTNPWLLKLRMDQQRSYTDHLIGRSSYEQHQSSRVLDALEQRLAQLEEQLTPPDSLSKAKLPSDNP